VSELSIREMEAEDEEGSGWGGMGRDSRGDM